MKKTAYFGILAALFCLFLLPGAGARAQESAGYGLLAKKPDPTPDASIYMIFSKLSGKEPDFEAMARATQVYEDTPVAYRPGVIDNLVLELKSTYSLLTLEEPFIVETPVKLSPYSAANKGFFVESFREETFFPFVYNGQSYAIVPQGIMDKQWLKVPDAETAREIEKAALRGEGGLIAMQLTLIPKYADSAAPVSMGGQDYWLISVDIRAMTLYAPDSTRLWQSGGDISADDTKRQELMKLRQ